MCANFSKSEVFHMLYLWNEVGDLQFICIFDISNSLSDYSKNLKISMDWKIFVQTSLNSLLMPAWEGFSSEINKSQN